MENERISPADEIQRQGLSWNAYLNLTYVLSAVEGSGTAYTRSREIAKWCRKHGLRVVRSLFGYWIEE